jgi:transketolase
MTHGLRIGIDRFGASAPAGDLFEKFGLTADAIVPQIMNKLNG